MAIAKVTRNYQVSIPAVIRKALKIHVGTLLEFAVVKGAVVVKPKVLIDESQAWFWTKEWQEGERQAAEDIKKKQTLSFKNVDEMRRHFEK